MVALAAVLALHCAPAADRGGEAPVSPSPTPVAAAPKTEPISWTHFDVPTAPPVTPELLARGKELFANNCSSCHGDAGAADGVCAQFLIPHPRDFTKGVFRFKTTAGGAMPTDTDLFRTISLGLHGTGMPPWKFLVSEEDRWALVAYVKTFSDGFEKSEAEPPVDLGPEPKQVTDEMRARGAELYAKAECAKCHGKQGYGDGPSAETLKDSFGNPIQPRNFHDASHFKRGHTLRDIALTVHTGNNGTPMPAYDASFASDEIWALAAHVMSLADSRFEGGGTPAAATSGEALGTPDVVVKLTEHHWKYSPDVIRVAQGQLVRVEFQPTDNGLGVGHGFAVDGYDKSVFINGAMVQRPKSVTFRADKAGTFTFYCATQCSTGSLHPHMTGKLIVEPAKS